MDFNKLLENVINSDQSIRFAAVFDRFGNIKEKNHRNDTSLMMDEYDTQNMLREAASSWYHRRNLESKLGKGHYSMTVYDNLVRMTMPLGGDYFIIVSHDKLDDQPQVAKKINQILETSMID